MSYVVEGVACERPFRIARLGHTGWSSTNLPGLIAFLRSGLGLAISDIDSFPNIPVDMDPELAKIYFMRCASDHHTLVVASREAHLTRAAANSPVVGQLSWQVGSLTQVHEAIDFLQGRAVMGRMGRDCPGSNWHVYFLDPDGYNNELFYGMEQIGWDGRSKPRSMYDRGFRERFEMPQISEHTEVERALARGAAFDGHRDGGSAPEGVELQGILAQRPFRITRLGRTLLDVGDMEVSLDFYCKVLGLKLTERATVGGRSCVFLRARDEHHSLVLCERGMFDGLGFKAAVGLVVADYGQLRAAREVLQREGLVLKEVPDALSCGIGYGFWVQGPDDVAIQLYTGMDRVNRDGSAPSPTTMPCPLAEWPQHLPDAERGWYEPPFLGPLA